MHHRRAPLHDRVSRERRFHGLAGGEQIQINLVVKAEHHFLVKEERLVDVRMNPDDFSIRLHMFGHKFRRNPFAVGNRRVIVLVFHKFKARGAIQLLFRRVPRNAAERLMPKSVPVLAPGRVADRHMRRHLRQQRNDVRQFHLIVNQQIHLIIRFRQRLEQVQQVGFRSAFVKLVDDNQQFHGRMFPPVLCHIWLYARQTSSAGPYIFTWPLSSHSALEQSLLICSPEWETSSSVAPESISDLVRAKLFSWNL